MNPHLAENSLVLLMFLFVFYFKLKMNTFTMSKSKRKLNKIILHKQPLQLNKGYFDTCYINDVVLNAALEHTLTSLPGATTA